MSVAEIEKGKTRLAIIAGKEGSSIGSTAVYASAKAGSSRSKRPEVVKILDAVYDFYENNKDKSKGDDDGDDKDGEVTVTGSVDIKKEDLVNMNVIKGGMDGAYDRAYEIAVKNILQNSRDQIFYETAEIITNTGGGRIPPSALLQNLILFVYADDKGRITQERINKTEKFQDIIFLTLVTRKTLLGNGMSQEDIYKQISQSANRSTLLHFNEFRRQKGCEKKTVGGRGLFSKSRTSYNCDPETWADIYSSFSEKQMKLAITKIIFSGQVL